MSRQPIIGVWGHAEAQNGPGREDSIWIEFLTATWQFWTKNGLKSAFLVGLRQNKAQKSRNHVKICPQRFFLIVLTHFGTPHSTQGSSRGASAWIHTRQHFVILISSELQNGLGPPRKTLSDIFWRVFMISGLYFAQNRPELHFLCKFSAKKCHFLGIWNNYYSKMAYKVHFWSISGKLTHKNDKTRQKYV